MTWERIKGRRRPIYNGEKDWRTFGRGRGGPRQNWGELSSIERGGPKVARNGGGIGVHSLRMKAAVKLDMWSILGGRRD